MVHHCLKMHIHGYNRRAFICFNGPEEIGELLLLFKCMLKFTPETLGLQLGRARGVGASYCKMQFRILYGSDGVCQH